MNAAAQKIPEADLSQRLQGSRSSGLFHHRIQTLAGELVGPVPPGNRTVRDLLHKLTVGLLYYLAESEPPERQNAAVLLRSVTDALEGQESIGPSGLDLMFVGAKSDDSDAWHAFRSYNEAAQSATRQERQAALYFLGARLQTILAAGSGSEDAEEVL